jgi:hypothetical protein
VEIIPVTGKRDLQTFLDWEFDRPRSALARAAKPRA